jgi:hypothetical protein
MMIYSRQCKRNNSGGGKYFQPVPGPVVEPWFAAVFRLSEAGYGGVSQRLFLAPGRWMD